MRAHAFNHHDDTNIHVHHVHAPTCVTESYKDATLIMQLLRDNLTLWTSDMNDDQARNEDDGTNVQDC